MTVRAYSRAERKVQVTATLAIKVQHGQQPQMTMYQIAKSLDMRPSTHLMKILDEMTESNDLDCWWKDHRPNKMKKVFSLPAGSYTMPKTQRREIKLSRAGVTYERLLV